MRELILASTSPYRRELLARLGLPFRCESPNVEEHAAADESPRELALRLARAKATAVARRWPDALVVGSDQVAELDGAPLGKPGSLARAVEQLAGCSARSVSFHTAVALVGGDTGTLGTHCDLTQVRFRALTDAEIQRYLAAETPFDCAGSFKSEGLGISLFEAIDSGDPTALVGLPLIALCALLREAGIGLP